MTSQPPTLPIVIERYHQIMMVFDDEREVWEQGLLMRMAAQVVATTPGNVVILAAVVRQRANEMLNALDWFRELEPPRRFAIASLLLQQQITVSDFADRMRQTSLFFGESGIACQPFTMALVTLIPVHNAPDRSAWTRQAFHRFIEIRNRMQLWQHRAEDSVDLVLSAVLALQAGLVEEVVAKFVAAYKGLLDMGLTPGPFLQIATILVNLGHASADDGVSHFLEIQEILELNDGLSRSDDYPIIALLSLIREPTERVIREYLSLRGKLVIIDSALVHTQNVCIVAADLSLLSLSGSGSGDGSLSSAVVSARQAVLHAFQLATVVQISHVQPIGDVVGNFSGQGWPQSARTMERSSQSNKQEQEDDGSSLTPLTQSILNAPTNGPEEPQCSDGSNRHRVRVLIAEPRLFGTNSRRADLVRWYPDLEPVCDRLGWGWDQPIGEWTKDPAAMLLALARIPPPAPPKASQDWSSALVSELVIELIDTYHRPLRREIERLGILIQHLDEAHHCQAVRDLHQEFVLFSRDEMMHFRFEEDVVFPLCITLEDMFRGCRKIDSSGSTASIRQMSHWHRANERDISTLNTLAAEAFSACHGPDPDIDVVRIGFSAMSARLAEHRLLEENILLPAAIAAEEQLSARSASRRLRRI